MFQRFKDRREAGVLLAKNLMMYAGQADAMVLGLPRGGVPIAFEVATALDLPLDVFVVRKLGVPGQQELAMGSIASGGICLVNDALIKSLQVPEVALNETIKREKAELDRRERLYRGNRPPIDVHGKTVMIVDDGLATGATMTAAITAIKGLGASHIVVAAPVASREACQDFRNMNNVSCVCGFTPEPFYGVGFWYQNFGQTSDFEVERLLARADAGGVTARHYV